MTDTQLLQELESLADRLSIDVSQVELDGLTGGLCRYGGKLRLIMDRNMDVLDHIEVFLKAFSQLSLDEVFVVPEVREMIEKRRVERGR